jgi:hypothetical protein
MTADQRELIRRLAAIRTVPCPVAGCKRRRKHGHVMCFPCWKLVPGKLQGLIWDLCRRAPASEPHLAAIAEAVRAVEERRSEAPSCV